MGAAKSGAWVFLTLDRIGSSLEGLGPILSHRRRRLLAGAIFRDVLQALQASRLVGRVLVSTRDPVAAALGRDATLPIVQTPQVPEEEASQAGSSTIAALVRGDLARLEGQDVAFLLGRIMQGRDLLLVPTPSSKGLSMVLGRGTSTFIADFEGGTLASWEEEARSIGLRHEVHAIPAGMRPGRPEDLLEVYTAARPSQAKALLKDWRMGPKLRSLTEEES